MKAIPPVGEKYNNWSVLKLTENKSKSRSKMALCQCECGLVKELILSRVVKGYTKQCRSCASKIQALNGKHFVTHGDSNGESNFYRLYLCWKNMKGRCYRKSSTHYNRYGGRGITVCDSWRKSYENFKNWAILNGWENNLTIDRIDVDGDYTPENCRWISNEDNVSLMSSYHYTNRTGGHSDAALLKRSIVNSELYGIKTVLISPDGSRLYFNSAKETALWLSDKLSRKIDSVYSQVKQCLNVNSKCVSVGEYKVEKDMKCTICRGISASGKTTWAEDYCKETGATNINRDDIRFHLFCGGERDWSLYKFTKQREKEVTQCQHEQIEAAAALGIDIVISDTNINNKTVTNLTEKLESFGYEVEIKDFWIDVMEALKRDAKRHNGVGYKVIMDQYKRYCQVLFSHEYHKHHEGKKSAIVVDVDGTVADMVGVRTPFEWNKVLLDKPHQHIIDIVNSARLGGLEIIFLSGRDGSCVEDTHAWLNKHVELDDFYLFMRSSGDMRKDTIVKKELFKKYIDNKFNVLYCIDDRPSVCRMWQYELGLKVLQVGDPYQEF